jgi:hypothetical protein
MHPDGQNPSPSGDEPMDATNRGDGDPMDGVWLTKAQLAAVRRISVASADRLIRRQGWRKHPGNDGRARVLVPADWAATRLPSPTDAPHANPTDDQPAHPAASAADPTDMSRAISAFEAVVSTLSEQLAAAISRADRAEADRRQVETDRGTAIALADQTVALLKDAMDRAGQAEGRAHEAEQARDRANAIADELRGRVEAAQQLAREAGRSVEAAQMAQAEAEADAAELRQAEAARKGRGVVARLRAAWRGE